LRHIEIALEGVAMPNIAVVSTYEGGMQPLGVATATSHLRAAGHIVSSYDSYVADINLDQLCSNDSIAVSIPLFDSVETALALFAKIKATNAELPVVFYGTHAMLNSSALLASGAAGVVLGDWEDTLVTAAQHIHQRRPLDGIEGLATIDYIRGPAYHRTGFRRPDRSTLPDLASYSYPEASKRVGTDAIVGNVETARGCRFSCTYCSVFAANPQKITVFPETVVLDDISVVVDAGATHICFTDAEFLNAPKHALEIARIMHDNWPALTFDFTTRADLIADDPRRIEQLVSYGAKFVTTAFEFPKQEVLDAINKQMTVATLYKAVAVCRQGGLGINPTFLLFNPWITFDDLGHFAEFLESNHLECDVEPVQLATRLWLYKKSPLLERPDVRSHIVAERTFNSEWRHTDPDVEDLFALMSAQQSSSGVMNRCCLKC
jgi:radical SAM superfamily enzyme YgiQ (UPF0313 family)